MEWLWAVLATALATFGVARFTEWLKARRVVWVPTSVLASWLWDPNKYLKREAGNVLSFDQRSPQAMVTLSNLGDGDAIGVVVIGVGCSIVARWNLEETHFLPEGLMATQVGRLKKRVVAGANLELQAITDEGAWDGAWILICWRQVPMVRLGSRGIRHAAFQLRSIAGPEPEYAYVHSPDPKVAATEDQSKPANLGKRGEFQTDDLPGMPGRSVWSRWPGSSTRRLTRKVKRVLAGEAPREILR